MSNVPYPQPDQSTPYSMQPEPKSKMTAALLAFFLGDIGIHNFYLGQKGRGIGHIVLTVIAVIIIMVGLAGAASTIDPDTGAMADEAAAGAGIGIVLGYLVAFVNWVWKMVEFVQILIKNDGSLR